MGDNYVLPIEQTRVTRQQAKVQQIIDETDAKARQIIDNAETKSQVVIQAANTEAENIIANAKKKAEQEYDKIKEQAYQEGFQRCGRRSYPVDETGERHSRCRRSVGNETRSGSRIPGRMAQGPA